MTDNVIDFPKSELSGDKHSKLPIDEEEMMNSVAGVRMTLADQIIDPYIHNLGSTLFSHGYSLDDDEVLEDFIFLGEMFRAFLYKSSGVKHPLYKVFTENKSLLKELTNFDDLDIMNDDDSTDEEY